MLTRIRFGGLAAALAASVPLVAAAQEHTALDMIMVGWFSGIGIVFVLGVVFLSLRANERAEQRRMALIEQYLEKGREVPRELLQAKYDGRSRAERRQHSFRRGVVSLFWAVGMAVMLYFLFPGTPRAIAWGVPFLFVGLAHVFNAVFLTNAGELRDGDSSK